MPTAVSRGVESAWPLLPRIPRVAGEGQQQRAQQEEAQHALYVAPGGRQPGALPASVRIPFVAPVP
jgi:hypothetical protein